MSTNASGAGAVKQIVHRNRKPEDDVNPLLRSSEAPLNDVDGNFVVAQMRNGSLRNLLDKPLSMGERLTRAASKYFEVDRRRYPMLVRFPAPTNQSSFRFDVSFEFELAVIDPCPIVESRTTSLMECVLTDLKRLATAITEGFDIENSKAASIALSRAFDAMQPPSFLSFRPGVVHVAPDAEASIMLRKIEEERLRIREQEARMRVEAAAAVASTVAQKAAESVEDHNVQGILRRGSGLAGERPAAPAQLTDSPTTASPQP